MKHLLLLPPALLSDWSAPWPLDMWHPACPAHAGHGSAPNKEGCAAVVSGHLKWTLPLSPCQALRWHAAAHQLCSFFCALASFADSTEHVRTRNCSIGRRLAGSPLRQQGTVYSSPCRTGQVKLPAWLMVT